VRGCAALICGKAQPFRAAEKAKSEKGGFAAAPESRRLSARQAAKPRALKRIALVGLALTCLLTILGSAGCRLDMHQQPRYNPLSRSTFFADGRSERPAVPGTVARGHARLDELFYTGRINGQLADEFPFPITAQDLERGRERYNIFCSPCHDYTGSGRGMIVQRGFEPPPSYHIARLRQAPVGHFFEVITNGYGAMYSYASRVPPDDRWRIAAYIRALQLSQHATLNDVPPADRGQLSGNHEP
jgi:Cytochrome C oxidase, cbb3-type, subunit III